MRFPERFNMHITKTISITLLALSSQVVLAGGSVEAGKALVETHACTSCHGADLKHPIAPNYPKIAGQHEDYLFYALKSYQVENNPQVGRNNAVMGAQAKKFTLSELKDLAAYVASLPGEFVIKK
jgi:cytochrome c553